MADVLDGVQGCPRQEVLKGGPPILLAGPAEAGSPQEVVIWVRDG